jgi:hypothetical protein
MRADAGSGLIQYQNHPTQAAPATPPSIGEKPIDLARFIPSTAKVVGALARLSCSGCGSQNEGYTVLLLYPNTTWNFSNS